MKFGLGLAERILLRVALAVFLLAGGPPAAGVAAENGTDLVVDGTFAQPSRHWWSKGADIRPVKLDDRTALQIPGGFAVQEKIKVEGGRRYRLSATIRSDRAPDGSVFIQLSARGPQVKPAWFGPLRVALDDRTEPAAIVTGGTQGWRDRDVVFETPVGAQELLIYLRKKERTEGVAYYTDVRIVEVDAPATTEDAYGRRELVVDQFSPRAEPAANAAVLARQLADAASPARRHAIIAKNRAVFGVHVGNDEDLMTLKAASDLLDHTSRLAGDPARRKLSNDLAVSSGPLLIIGRNNALARKLLGDRALEGLGEDGFVIRSFGPHILIAGATSRGTMYGVNWFLDRKLGIRWLTPTETFVPSTAELSLDPQTVRQRPRFGFREVLSVEAEDKAWRQRNLMNGESHGPSFSRSPPALDSWNRSWAAKGGIANFFELLPPATYAKAHPEWYSGGQLAMMDPAMRKEMAKRVVERLRSLPDYRNIWFAVHDMDWGWDMDPASKAFADRHGGHPAAPRLDMMIDVADQVRAVLPGAKLAFNAYHWSFTPPTGMSVPDHILVYPMTVHVNYAGALNEPANRELGRDLAEWNRIAKHVIVWDHITNFAGFLQPTPNLLPIARSIRWLATLGNVQGYMGEGSFDTPGAEFAALRAWLIARLLWDPEQDPQALIDDFCEKYYGPAAPKIEEYIRFIHHKLARSGDILSEKTTVDMAMFDAEFVEKSERLFDEAEALTKNTAYFERVRAARVPVDYVILLRRSDYAQQAREIGHDVTDTLAARKTRFWDTLQATRVRRYIQGGRIAELRDLIDIERHPAPIPDIARGFPKWKDIQDPSFQRYAGAKSTIVADPLASDGAAIALDPSSKGWNVQLRLDKLPQEGRWWLYASLRTEGFSREGDIIARLGAAPPMNRNTVICSTGDLATGYHWVEVPAGPFSYSADPSNSIYLQPVAGPAGSRILLDRIVALPAPAPTVARATLEGTCH